MTTSVCAAACMGCGAADSLFQCPLCQAEAYTVQGFFCSQACFAKNWLQHRNDFHKRGVVRESKGTVAMCGSSNDSSRMSNKGKKSSKRSRNTSTGGEEIEVITDTVPPGCGPPMFPPWTPLPNAHKYLEQRGVEPDLGFDCPRAIVGACVDDVRRSFWPSLVAAAHYVAASVRHDSTLMVLVVAGCPYSAHAFAWAARCAGMGGALKMALTLHGLPEVPSQYFTPQKHVVVATEAVVGHAGSGAASLWMERSASLLVTLPDVETAGDLQGVNTRGIFFVSKRACKDAAIHGVAAQEGVYRKKRGKKQKLEDNKVLVRLEAACPGSIADEEPTHEVAAAVQDMCCDEENGPLLWQPELTEKNSECVGNMNKDSITSMNGGSIAPNKMLSNHHVPHCIRHLTDRMDNDVSSALANGDIEAAMQHLVRVFSTTPGYFEEILFNSLRCDWGAVDVVHAHHRLAYIMRYLVDQSSNFSSPKGATMADMVFRAMVPLVRMIPSLHGYKDVSGGGVATVRLLEKKKHKGESEEEVNKVLSCPSDPMTLPSSAQEREKYFNFYSSLPNLQLQATITYLSGCEASPATLDALAKAWGVTHYIKAGGLVLPNSCRKNIIHRLRSRYKSRLGSNYAEFLVTLMHIIYDAVAIYSLPLEEVACRLQWDLTLATDVGSLGLFLELCGLQTPASNNETKNAGGAKSLSNDKNKEKSIINLSSRQVRPLSRTELLRSHEVKAAVTESKGSKSKDVVHPSSCYIPLPWLPFPMSGKRQQDVSRLQKAALDEILMAMPREPRPMYIGDLGNLIGKWNGFNSRFGGVLGSTLSEFLLKHPNEFRVVGGLVSRVKNGRNEPVRIRFDNDAENLEDHSDSDDDKASRVRKAQDHALLTGISKKVHQKQKKAAQLEKDLPAHARKKRAIKEFNKQRFNKNYKPFDPSARVPGYVKHGPRKIKGRGKKVNMHAFKRN
ncbi:unnamed protein product [Phytomonas sp. EM1]|nr:unnamed protein product [Phytomonas sp. EM1]|eukprot:CCW61463.1 unnamed protein product [Phytomonas sp. isolate EM1]